MAEGGDREQTPEKTTPRKDRGKQKRNHDRKLIKEQETWQQFNKLLKKEKRSAEQATAVEDAEPASKRPRPESQNDEEGDRTPGSRTRQQRGTGTPCNDQGGETPTSQRKVLKRTTQQPTTEPQSNDQGDAIPGTQTPGKPEVDSQRDGPGDGAVEGQPQASGEKSQSETVQHQPETNSKGDDKDYALKSKPDT